MLSALIADLKAAPVAEAMADRFAEAKDEVNLDNFWFSLGALGQLAGLEVVLVNKWEIKDLERDRHLVFASEGALQDPQNEINRALSVVW